MKLLISILFLLCLFVGNGFAQEAANKKYVAKVHIAVSANDDIKPLLYSYLTRELRSIPDVELIDTVNEWSISIIVIPSVVGDRLYGYALSYNFVNDGDYIAAGLKIFTKDNLQETCKKIVGEFDGEYLEKDRKLYKEFPVKLNKFYLGTNAAKLINSLRDKKTDIDNLQFISEAIYDLSPEKFTKLIYYIADMYEEDFKKYYAKKLENKIKN